MYLIDGLPVKTPGSLSRIIQPSFVVFFLALLLEGCAATPRYQSVKRLVAPVGPTTQACLSNCAAAMEKCKQTCAETRENCGKDAMPEAEAHYAQELKNHQSALRAYHWDLERYRMELLLQGGYGYPYGVWGWYPPPPPPSPPALPDKERVIKRFIQKRCDRDCGCQSEYEACFLGCGGRIETETLCIANCPPP